MTTRINKGRQRVNMVKMKNARNLQVTFSTRLAGLFKKSNELCMLFNAEIFIVVFSQGDKGVLCFDHPSVNPLAEGFFEWNLPQPHINVHNQHIVARKEGGTRDLSTKLMSLKAILEKEKNCGQILIEIRKRANSL